MKPDYISYEPIQMEETESSEKAEQFYQLMNKRRSIRHFSDKPVPQQTIENIIKTAGTAPSGANKQPWVFCAIQSKTLKHRIRNLAEKEEKINYASRMGDLWKKDLEKLGTDENKPFLEIAPWLIIIMKKTYDLDATGNRQKNYYVNESVGIAAGILIASIHNAGLVTLTHTPSPMDFLAQALNRPINEKPYLLLPVGYAADTAQIPNIQRKPINEIIKYYG
ncbi:nitroreductase family protein [Putridiphycobacter roseus]|uniref:Nitroreductase family protein n=1 Tax=Putridiphycobacter roseus TaxID=2219161 RepID=A0A2W1MZD5_9FLAO|nr:nitroreductase family protein [Putridiphycobacter roseus]PZE16620.1 nitroreductase family protein [Putridiphycobacter roseus]